MHIIKTTCNYYLTVYSAFVHVAYSKESVNFDGLDFTSSSRLQKTGTTKAYKAIVDGNADIIFAAKPSQEQLEYAENSRIDLIYVPIGYEAFVFFVNSKNTVQELTMEQIRGIYSGKYKNWREVGGEKTPIIAVQRVDGSGSQTAMAAFMEDEPLMNRPASIIGRAIGYSFRLYVSNLAGKNNLKMLAINGVEPTEENIRNGIYPLMDCFYAVFRADNQKKNVKILIEWILSDEGQYIVEKTGYVPVKN